MDKFLSTIGHVKSGGNLGRPLSKAKYERPTDSEPVPRGKGEKYLKPYAYKQFEPYAFVAR